MTHTNLNREVIVTLKAVAGRHRVETGVVIAQATKKVRGRDRTILTIQSPTRGVFDQDARYVDFGFEFMEPREALAEIYLNEVLDARA